MFMHMSIVLERAKCITHVDIQIETVKGCEWFGFNLFHPVGALLFMYFRLSRHLCTRPSIYRPSDIRRATIIRPMYFRRLFQR